MIKKPIMIYQSFKEKSEAQKVDSLVNLDNETCKFQKMKLQLK